MAVPHRCLESSGLQPRTGCTFCSLWFVGGVVGVASEAGEWREGAGGSASHLPFVCRKFQLFCFEGQCNYSLLDGGATVGPVGAESTLAKMHNTHIHQGPLMSRHFGVKHFFWGGGRGGGVMSL